MVETQHHLTVRGALEHLETGGVGELTHRLRNSQVGDDVQLARQHRRHHGVRIGVIPEVHLVHARPGSPVVLVAHQRNHGSDIVTREDVGTGTSGLFAQVLPGGEIVDDPGGGRDVIQPALARCRQGHLHRVIIDGTHLLDAAHLLLENLGGALAVPGAFEGCDHRGRVDGFPGREGGIGFQLEGVDAAVGAGAPRPGQQRFDLTLLVDTHQRLVDVVQQHERRARPRVGGRIHTRGLSRRPHVEDDGIRATPAGPTAGRQAQAEPEQHGQQGRQTTEGSVGSHVYVSPVWTAMEDLGNPNPPTPSRC